jgi:hypothetical protein
MRVLLAEDPDAEESALAAGVGPPIAGEADDLEAIDAGRADSEPRA